MAAFYGDKWITNFDADPGGIAGDSWAVGLADLSADQLAAGLHTFARSISPFPPTMQEFRAACLGIPSFAEAVYSLRPGNPEPTPFARLLWRYLDPWRLQHANEGAAESMIRQAYELASRFLAQGGKLPDASARIAHDPAHERALYDEIHRRRMEALMAERVANDGNP